MGLREDSRVTSEWETERGERNPKVEQVILPCRSCERNWALASLVCSQTNICAVQDFIFFFLFLLSPLFFRLILSFSIYTGRWVMTLRNVDHFLFFCLSEKEKRRQFGVFKKNYWSGVYFLLFYFCLIIFFIFVEFHFQYFNFTYIYLLLLITRLFFPLINIKFWD